ncbi:MAG: hypothetical protein ACO1PW_14675, partial [Actinomycetota bacterium]
MSASAGALLERLAPGEGSGGPRAERGRAWLGAHGLPTGRDEAWRYTPVEDVIDALASATPATAPVDPIDRATVDELAG